MPELSRAQLIVYAALAVVALLLGSRWIRADGAPAEPLAFGNETPRSSPADRDGVAVTSSGEDLVVHVAGEVRRPGVYRLPEGSRVTDALERAGGVTARAAADAVNLAARLADGQQIQIPARQQGSTATAAAAGAAAGAEDGPISLGTATVEQLDTIEGIGPVTASAILDFRDERGGIASIDELDEISGIGPATMEALRARLQP